MRRGGATTARSVLLLAARDVGYQGMLALEPHLAIAGHSSFSGVEGMTYAAETLRKLMADVGCGNHYLNGEPAVRRPGMGC